MGGMSSARAEKKLALTIILLAASFSAAVFAARVAAEAVPALGGTQYTLVIDAGHGGIDSGATGLDGSKESDVNLAIALKLRALAEFYSIDNVMIRQDDSTLSDSENYSERDDLICRTEIVNETANPVLISIHQNSYPTGQPHGAQVIYSSADGGETLGKITHANLISTLDQENRRVAEPATDKLYILTHVSCPAILVECGFMSNFSDFNKLTDSEYQCSLSAVLMASYLQFCVGELQT